VKSNHEEENYLRKAIELGHQLGDEEGIKAVQRILKLSADKEGISTGLSKERWEALFYISQRLTSTVKMEGLLDEMLIAIMGLLNAERGVIIFKNPDGHFQIASQLSADGKQVTLSETIVEKALASHEPQYHRDAVSDLTASDSVQDLAIKSVICVPLITKQEPQGVIYIDNRSASSIFTQEDLILLRSFASMATISVDNARLISQLEEENVSLRREASIRYKFENLIGNSQEMQKVFKVMEVVIDTDATVLIEGNSGTGKELIARAIHYNGPRKEKRFIPVDCGAMPETLLEGELFGHKKGAYTGADTDRTGLFEAATGGTIFLDEISNTTPAFQVKLLRVLQEGEIRRLGENQARKVDVRIITATNKSLEVAVKEGEFRKDLFFRLNVIRIEVPDLKKRRDDIPLLVEFFINRYATQSNREPPGITKTALDALIAYHWPGNVRELENAIERAVIFAKGRKIQIEDLPENITSKNAHIYTGDIVTLEEIERRHILLALKEAKGSITHTAEILGIHRNTLSRKIKDHNIKDNEI
jgi:Nif-specific regulatory protein